MDRLSKQAEAAIDLMSERQVFGTVTKILGLLIEIAGFGQNLSIGSIVHLKPDEDTDVSCEVVGFREGYALLMLCGTLEGIGLGCKAVIQDLAPVITPDETWLGRVINGLGQPIDGLGRLHQGGVAVPLR